MRVFNLFGLVGMRKDGKRTTNGCLPASMVNPIHRNGMKLGLNLELRRIGVFLLGCAWGTTMK